MYGNEESVPAQPQSRLLLRSKRKGRGRHACANDGKGEGGGVAGACGGEVKQKKRMGVRSAGKEWRKCSELQ